MKSRKIWIGITILAVYAVLLITAILFLPKNEIGKTNSLKRKARKEYLTHQYTQAASTYHQIIDSVVNPDHAAVVNYANAVYLSANEKDNTQQNDSVKLQKMQESLRALNQVTTSSDNVLRSMAANQSGFVTIKKSEAIDPNSVLTDSVLTSSLYYFQDAVRQDPENNYARYNYELIKRIARYPETILADAKSLIAQKKYREAASLLEQGMKRDQRLQKHKEFLTRVKTIIGIDSLKTSL